MARGRHRGGPGLKSGCILGAIFDQKSPKKASKKACKIRCRKSIENECQKHAKMMPKWERKCYGEEPFGDHIRPKISKKASKKACKIRCRKSVEN